MKKVTRTKVAKTVDEYILRAPEWARGTLRAMRSAIRSAAPKAEEKISYQIPYYGQDGRLAYFSAYTNHSSFHWISTSDKRSFAKELAKETVVGQTLRIPKGKKPPVGLIKKIIRARVLANAARKKTKKKA